MANGGNWSEAGINPTFGQAYIYSAEAGNELINFDGAIWDNEIEEILENCRKYEIKEFTISSGFSSLIEILDKLSEQGCEIEGLVKINSTRKDYSTGKLKTIPALKISL